MIIKLKYSSVINYDYIVLISASLYIVALFFANFSNELNIDEYATWWVSNKGFVEAIFNTTPYPPHPITYGLASLSIQFLDGAGLGLRLPNLFFVVGSLFLFVKFFKQIFARDKCYFLPLVLLVLIYCTSESTMISLLVARSYGASQFFLLLSFVCILSIEKKGMLLLSSSAGFLAVLNQPAFAAYKIAGTWFLLFFLRSQQKYSVSYVVKISSIISLVVIIAVATSSVIGIWSLVENAKVVYAFMPILQFDNIIGTIVGSNPVLGVCLFILLLASVFCGATHLDLKRVYILLSIAVAQLLGLYFMSVFTGSNLMVPRYSCFTELLWAACLIGLLNDLCKFNINQGYFVTLLILILYVTYMPENLFKSAGWNETINCIQAKSDKNPLIVYIPEHALATVIEMSSGQVELDAWLAPLKYVGAQNWSELTLLSHNNYKIAPNLDLLLQKTVSQTRSIVVLYPKWIGEHANKLMSSVLNTYNYEQNLYCESNVYKANIFKPSLNKNTLSLD
jgi:hypothetical protein